MDNEIWKNVDVDNGYMVSDFGKVKSLKTNKILKQYTDKYGYLHVSMSINGRFKNMLVHRLVALTFIPNPENKPQVNHIDGDKSNNELPNLEWSTRSENIQHAYKKGLRDVGILRENGEKNAIKINQVDKNTLKVVKTWDSASDIKRELGYDKSYILRCCKKINKSAYGYFWEYKEATYA